MIKTNVIVKETIDVHKYCDVCGTEIQIGLASSVAKCKYCKKDLCEKCIEHEEYSSGDYRGDIYCKECWLIGIEYNKQIKEYENKIDELYDEWESKCINVWENKV